MLLIDFLEVLDVINPRPLVVMSRSGKTLHRQEKRIWNSGDYPDELLDREIEIISIAELIKIWLT